MSSLSEHLKSLGVTTGTQHLKNPPQPSKNTIDDILEGKYISTQSGETYVVENTYNPENLPTKIQFNPPLHAIASWAGDERIADLSLPSFAFLDTETTGLSGGTGTYAFLIGVGRFIDGNFMLTQLFMHDPGEEPAQLQALEQYLAPCEALVTFNGKAFDVPLLMTRYRTHNWKPLLADLFHLDLLHLSRRLWRDRLSNRSLNSLEVHILGTHRTEDDVPGWMIPQLYFEYLRDGDAQPLKNVFYHNAMDILSLAALFNYEASILADPTSNLVRHAIDLISLGSLFEDLGQTDKAVDLYRYGLDHEDARQDPLPRDIYIRALFRMSLIHKRSGEFKKAIPLWEQAAQCQYIPAHIELAKYYEHRVRDINTACTWTQTAISIINKPENGLAIRLQWEGELQHRLRRLERKRTRNP